MSDGKTCPQRCAMATIKGKKFIVIIITEQVRDALSQIFSRPSDTQSLALDAKKGNFVEGINHAQPCIEFQTINDADGLAEKNVFRPQIPMPVDDVPTPDTFGQHIVPFAEKTPLCALYMAHHASWKPKTWIKQNTAIVSQAPPKFRDVGGG
jgi:hypothetical protein